jgi:predicted DNA-binding transcriptional regulator AlpA
MTHHEVMNDKQAARFIGISVATIRKWRFERKGPSYVRLGRSIRYFRVDLESFIEAKRINVMEE